MILLLNKIKNCPFDNGGNSIGIFISNVATFEEAKVLLKDDTTIKEKYLEPEFYYVVWFGSFARRS